MSRITPPVPNTTLTPAYSSVSSTAGFQSGDLVYFRDSSFGPIPNNAVTSANFALNATVNQNQIAFNTTVNWAKYDPNTRTGSTISRAPSVATLTNGNIVVSFAEHSPAGPAAACFRIIDQNGAVVVDRTTLGFNSVGLIGVCALTGGGFAIASTNSATGTLFHGVYSNTGAVVTAMVVDSFFGNNVPTMDIRALSGGGYVIGCYIGASQYVFRVYSSTGVPGTTATASGWGSAAQIVITTFSDNTFAALYPDGGSSLRVTRFNNTGGIVANYAVTTDLQTSAGYDFITLSTGTGIILNVDVDGGVNRMYGRTYDQSTGAIGGRNAVAGSQNFQQNVNALALSSGGFVATNGVPGTGVLQLRRYNASFGFLSAVDLLGLPATFRGSQTASSQRTTIIEGATFLTFVDNSFATESYTYHSMPYIQINKTDITSTGIRRRFSATQTVANIAAPVSGYARSVSTPNAASFLATNTQTLTQTVPASSGTTFALAPFVAVTDNSITTHCLTDMANGQFVVSYRATNGSVRFSVFNPDGSQFLTSVVTASGAIGLTRCTCIGNGRLVVTWVPSSNDRINFSVFAAGTYALLATGTTSGSPLPVGGNPSDWNSAAGHDVAPFGNDFFVLGYANQAGGASAAVYSDAAVYQSHANSNAWSGISNVRIVSDAVGDVALKYFSSSQGNTYITWFARDTTANSIFIYADGSLSGATGQNFGEGMAMSPYGSVFALTANSGVTRFLRRAMVDNTTNNLSYGSFSYNSAGVCVGQNGEFVYINIDGNGQFFQRFSVVGSNGPYGTSVNQSPISSSNITITGFNTNANVGSQAQIVNLYDNIYAFSYINGGNSSSGGQIVIGFVNTVATTYTSTITAGVTPSNTALVPSPANGYYLAGVSASECAAGGTGVLQINGAATLNSQYPAGTPSQAFDFNTPALDVGVRGTIAGRNMIISGGK